LQKYSCSLLTGLLRSARNDDQCCGCLKIESEICHLAACASMARSANAPALVDVALPIEFGKLQGGAIVIVIGLDEIGSNLDRHLFLVRPSAKASLSVRPSKRPGSISLSRFISASKVGTRSTLLEGVRTVTPRLKSAPQAMNVLRTLHGDMLPWLPALPVSGPVAGASV
jgi:hypothetical protein